MEQFWDSLQELIKATSDFDLEKSLHIVLNAGKSLSGAEVLAIYLANENTPGFQRYGTIGADKILPVQLPVQDIIYLQTPSYWTFGKRADTTLHKSALQAKLNYIASAPMGQPNAIIGLVVIGNHQGVSTEYTLQITKLLASTTTAIIHGHFQQKLIEDALELKEKQLMYSTILEEQIHEGLIILDGDLIIQRLNMSAEMLLGYNNREIQGQPAENILIGSDSLKPALSEARYGSANYNLGDTRLFRRNGEQFPAHVRTFPVRNGSAILGVVVLIADLSEEEQIKDKAKKLEQQAFLGEVTAILAHEVRNPINNISTGLQVMAYNLSGDDPNLESIERLQQDVDRLEELMKSVLTFSRAVEFDMDVVNLVPLLNRIMERVKSRLEKTQIEPFLQIDPDTSPITGNSRALEQVLTNLINNAIQAMRETGGKLIVKTQIIHLPEGEETIEISVTDTGPGIPKEIQEKIFQPYFTTDRSGTGLGLAIAERIIKAHDGTIHLESFPVGSIFRIHLPIRSKESVPTR